MFFLRLVSFTSCNYVPFPRMFSQWLLLQKLSWSSFGLPWAGAFKGEKGASIPAEFS